MPATAATAPAHLPPVDVLIRSLALHSCSGGEGAELQAPCEPPAPGDDILTVHEADSPTRQEVERFIAGVYRDRFGADVQAFAPVLVSRRGTDGELCAAAGYRPADAGALYLERYLDTSVDQALGAPRAQIVEVGHLAACRAGEGRRLILQLGPWLARSGFRWAVSTMTEELRHLFLRLGVAQRALGVADPSRLGDAASGWGRYYEHHPIVLASAIGPALQARARRESHS